MLTPQVAKDLVHKFPSKPLGHLIYGLHFLLENLVTL